MMSDKQFEQLSEKLDTLIRLLAGTLLRDAKSKTEKIEILYGLGISTKDISQFVGTTEGSVETIKKRLRKRAKLDKAKPTGGEKSAEN